MSLCFRQVPTQADLDEFVHLVDTNLVLPPPLQNRRGRPRERRRKGALEKGLKGKQKHLKKEKDKGDGGSVEEVRQTPLPLYFLTSVKLLTLTLVNDSCRAQVEEDLGPSRERMEGMQPSAGKKPAAAYPQIRVVLNQNDIPLAVSRALEQSMNRSDDSVCPYIQDSSLTARVSQLEASSVQKKRFDFSADTSDRVGGRIEGGWLSSDVSCDSLPA